MKVSFKKSWSEATKRKPDELEMTSKKGTPYKTHGFKGIRLVVTSSPTYNEDKGKYEYHAVDPKTNMEYDCIRCKDKVDCTWGTHVDFFKVTGGLAGDTTWFNAESCRLSPTKG